MIFCYCFGLLFLMTVSSAMPLDGSVKAVRLRR
jgi:hypothetical protein